MDGEAIVAVSAAVVALTQLAKWGGLQARYAPFAVLAISLFGTAFWAWDRGGVSRGMAFEVLAGWIAIAMAAAGVFGFVREGAEVVTDLRKPSWKPGDPDRRG